MRAFPIIFSCAALTLAVSPAAAAITAFPTFTKNMSNTLCLSKSPLFDKRANQAGYIYCSTANDGAPNGEIQVDKYLKVSGSSAWQGSCKASCSNLNQWPPLLSLPDVTGALCP